jgi:hypothetical protein
MESNQQSLFQGLKCASIIQKAVGIFFLVFYIIKIKIKQ